MNGDLENTVQLHHKVHCLFKMLSSTSEPPVVHWPAEGMICGREEVETAPSYHRMKHCSTNSIISPENMIFI